MQRLRDFAGMSVLDKLVYQVEDMNIVAPMGNPPRPECFFNTKLAIQYSRQPRAASALPVEEYPCFKCSVSEDQAQVGVGHTFRCPICSVLYTRRYVYETGSGRSSIGRNVSQFKVRPFTEEMEELATIWETEDPSQTYNNFVLVMYCGAAFCANCALDVDHQTKICASTLGYHRDNGDGSNSQSLHTVNRTLNVGATRTLSMELRENFDHRWGTVEGMEAEFRMRDGSEFLLDTSDEVTCTRLAFNGKRVTGAWFHGMQTPVGESDISCGYVGRNVRRINDVRLEDDVVIMKTDSGHLARQAAYEQARSVWVESQSKQYLEKVRHLAHEAVQKWTVRRSKVSAALRIMHDM
jgi:hypothetical protein